MDRHQQEFQMHIVVHRGSIQDTSHQRRIGLWFVPCERGSQYYFHVKRAIHNYQFEIKRDWDPTCTGSALPLIYIGRTDKLSASELVKLLTDVPIENHNLEFNGQQWIWEALTFLVSKGHLTRRQLDDGFEQMLVTVLQGSADELPETHHGHIRSSSSSNGTTDVV
ncbi:hypothetical protein J3459_011263 [Metarhizium acridum]|uniref:Uncharacterized protein n=1 Tax=Metarhizium acridum (strain CQMa 102) TaxID=655827 RepID=E9E666_METAQ|nr:uncharacterized protein MAC_05364 [Metarhizium acridum CQMa 102]EFY88599.1 hypothetical protein MAC_05364 [Metarhizium acridum CQMa 102]KAG8415274.1 hypothetical protein J3458_009135 [Metarhizium acridum]KAG8420254.1 hypothetical protein J3459_011263 [Metarhizium acridum]